MEIRQVKVSVDPTGTITLSLTGVTPNGQVVIANMGGVPVDKVLGATSVLSNLLTTAKAHVSTLYSVEQAKIEALTSGQIKA